jgi:hypothetical protein
MFQDLADKLLSWLDDLLLHGRDVDGLRRVQDTFLNGWAARGVKLGAAQNGPLLARGPTVRTCGIQGRSLARPELLVCLGGRAAAGDVCRLAAACVRSAVPSYAQVLSTLGELLEEEYKRAGGQTRKRAAKVRFCEL